MPPVFLNAEKERNKMKINVREIITRVYGP